MYKLFGAAKDWTCVRCGAQAAEWAYDGTDSSERSELILGRYPVKYSVWPEFYIPLCFPCHRAMDRGAWAQRREVCTHGHGMTLDNTYTRPSRPGTRECRTCKDDEYVRRRLAIGKDVPSRGIFASIELVTPRKE